MQCPKCGAQVGAEDRFCGECGQAALPAGPPTCPSCGAEYGPAERFCGECGAQLPASSAAAPAGTTGEVCCFRGHTKGVVQVAFTADGRRAWSAGEDGTLRLWDLGSGAGLACLSVGPLGSAAFSGDGRLGLCSGGGELRLWDLHGAAELRSFPGYILPGPVALSLDGEWALAPSIREGVFLWNGRTGEKRGRVPVYSSEIAGLSFSPDHRWALIGTLEAEPPRNAVSLWNLETLAEGPGPEPVLSLLASVSFSPDGTQGIAACLEGTVLLWDLRSGKEIRRFPGHAGNVLCAAVSRDGKRVLTASGTDYYDAALLADLGVDNTVRLWDVETGHELCRLQGHAGNVNAAVFSPDGSLALSGSADGTVRAWRLPAC